MRKQLLGGLTSLLIPFAAYGANTTYGAYQRRQSAQVQGYQPLSLTGQHTLPVSRSSITGNDELNLIAADNELIIAAGAPARELVIIDAAVPDKAVLQSAARPGVDVVILKAGEDALQQTAALLKNYRNLDAVHLVSHGESGAILLGNHRIDKTSLETQPGFMVALNAATRTGADLLLYGCDLAKDDTDLLELIQQNSHLDIAASNNLTGAAELGGDWTLEIAAGNIETSQPFSSKALQDFSEVLRPFGTQLFEVHHEVRSKNPSIDWGNFTTYANTPTADYEIMASEAPNWTHCEDGPGNSGLYVSFYFPASRFFVRSNPSGERFGVTGLNVRAPASGTANPADEVTIFGYDDSATLVGTKGPIALSPDAPTGIAIDLTTGVTGSFADIVRFRIAPDNIAKDQVDFCLISVDFTPPDNDGGLTAAGGITGPVGLDTTIDTAAEAVDVLDFTLGDGGTSDMAPLKIPKITVNVSGTATDAERSQITWRLNRPDAGNVTGSYDAGTDTLTFSGLNISVADGGSSGVYTIDARYNDNSGLSDGHTIQLSLDGGGLTTDPGGSRGDVSTSVSNDVTLDVAATKLAFTTQPVGSVSGAALNTQPVVAAQDAAGNVDTDFNDTITLSEASDGSLTNNTLSATGGIAAFTNLIYSASADNESFTLTADGGSLPAAVADPLTSDVVATQLTFLAQPAPITVTSNLPTALTVIPVVGAVDANGDVDLDYSIDITLTEENGAGSANINASGDTDGDSTTATVTPNNGVSTFTGLNITYLSSGGDETFNLRAVSGALSADSTVFTANQPPTDITLDSDSVNYSDGVNGVVGSLGAADLDTLNSHSYSLVAGSGDTDNGSFNISGNQLRVDDAESLTDGSYSVRIQTEDNHGGTFQKSFTITVVDDIAPTVSSVDALSASGTYVAGDNLYFSVNTSENVTVYGLPPTRIPLTFDSGTVYAEFVGGSNSSALTYRYTVQAGDNDADGIEVGAAIQLSEEAAIKDSAGNDLVPDLNNVAATTGVRVDAVAPDAPSTPDLAAASDTGASATDNITADTTPTLTGSAEPNSTVALVSNADGTLGTTAADGSGNWSFTPGAALSEGSHSITATATDAVGHTSTASTGLSLTLDTTAPAVPSVPDLVAASDSGSSDSDDITSETTPTLSGTAEADSLVTIVSSEYGELGTTTADGSGNWSFTPGTPLSDNTYSLTAVAIDAAGNASAASNALSVTVDSQVSSVNSLALPVDGSYTAGQNLEFTVQYDDAVTVTGAPRLELTIGTSTRYATYVSGSGNTLTFSYAVQPGDNDGDGIALASTLDINSGVLQDAAGNDANTSLGTIGSLASVLVDTQAPNGHSVSFDDNAINATEASFVSFTFASAEVGADYSYTISSSGGGTPVVGTGTMASAADRVSGVDVSGLSDGVVTLSVTLTDSVGNAAVAVTGTSTLDAAAPLPVVTSVASDPINGAFTVAIAFGEVVTGFVADDITVVNGSVSLLQDDGGGQFTATIAPLSQGIVTVDVTADVAQDTAGNNNQAATQFSIEHDSLAPAPTINASIIGSATNGSFTATIDFGEAVTGFGVGDIAAGNATLSAFADNGDGSFGVTVTPTTDGAVTVDVGANVAQDIAGNNNTAATQYSVTYDGIAPTLSSSTPMDDATDVQYDAHLVLTFSENVAANAGAGKVIEIHHPVWGLVDTLIVTSSNVTVAGNTVTADIFATLSPNQTYNVQIANGAFSDGAGNPYAGIGDTTTLNFTVGNNDPVATNDTATVDEDDSVQVAVLANDTDVDSSFNAASVQVISAPANGSTSVNTGTGVITYTPSANFNGSDSFTYTVKDVHGGTSSESTVSITVDSINDAPTAVNDLDSTPEDNAVAVDVAVNDTDVDTGDSVNPATLVVVSQPENGTAVVSGGEITYTPEQDFNGSDSFTYTIEDQNGAVSSAATVVVNVTGVNDLPTAANDTATVDEDDAVVIDVVGNDNDLDGTIDATTVLVMAAASHGATVVDAITGAVTYTPEADFNGSDSFTYVVKDDADGTSNEATVTLTVNSVNDAPIANADIATVQEDVAYEINVLGNDSDIDGSLNAASVEVVTLAADGTTSVDAVTGAITYSPGGDFNGSDGFTYRVMDDGGLWSPVATVTLTIQQVNDAPLANNDAASTDEDTPVAIQILTNDTDVDGTLDIGTIIITSPPAHGDVIDNGDGTVNYTPDANYHGSDSFAYSVQDDWGDVSNTATVGLTINAVNDAPTISGAPPITVNEGVTYNFMPAVSDVDGDDLTFSISQMPAWATFDPATGMLTGNPANDDVGVNTNIIISVSDGTESVDLPSFNIEVLNVNGTPVIGGVAPTHATVGELYSFAPVASDADVGDVLSYSATGLPAWLSVNTLTGLISGIPADMDVGSYDGIGITVSDGEESISLAISIQVVPGVDGDGDSSSDYQEGLDGTDPADPDDYLDPTPPLLTAPAEQTLDAMALYTPVTVKQLLGLESTASSAEVEDAFAELTTDDVDGDGCCNPVPENLTDDVIYLPPGRNEVTWLAADRKGNTAEIIQVVNLRPLVSLSMDQTTTEGANVTIEVILNGESPFYPLTVPFVVDTASTAGSGDHDLVSGTVTFTETAGVGQTRASISVAITADAISEDDETLLVRLDDQTSNAEDLVDGYDPANPDIFDINSGVKIDSAILIVERNLAPRVTLGLAQNGVDTSLIARTAGDVTVTATVTDPNPGDTHSLDWSGTDNRLVDTDGDVANGTLVFDPAELSPGRYELEVRVTDAEGAATVATRYFVTVQDLPVLAADEDSDGDGVDDATEGTADTDQDGIVDYLDSPDAGNLLPQDMDERQSYLIECEPGLECRRGRYALLSDIGGARLSSEDLETQTDLAVDDAYTPEGGIVDFEVHGLTDPGQIVRVAIPQRVAVPEDAVYRKFQEGVWMTFVENANNALHSAPGNPGYCPPPGDGSWEQGLVTGHLCVQLTLEDGGPNDADGLANRVVQDPGAVSAAIPAPPEEPEEPQVPVERSVESGGGGGGAINLVFLMFISGLLLTARPTKRGTVKKAGLAMVRHGLENGLEHGLAYGLEQGLKHGLKQGLEQ